MLRLHAQLGHGGGFPVAGAKQRPQAVQPRRGVALRADDFAVGIDLQPQPQRIDAEQPSPSNCRTSGLPLRPRSVDGPVQLTTPA